MSTQSKILRVVDFGPKVLFKPLKMALFMCKSMNKATTQRASGKRHGSIKIKGGHQLSSDLLISL